MLKITKCLVIVFLSQVYMSSAEMNMINVIDQDDVEMVLYFMSPDKLTLIPVDKNYIKVNYDYKVVITGKLLKENKKLFLEIDNQKCPKNQKNSKINLKIYGEFISNNKIVYSFGLNYGYDMLVNDVVVEAQYQYYELVEKYMLHHNYTRHQKEIKNTIKLLKKKSLK